MSKPVMDLSTLLQLPGVECTAQMHFRLVINLPFVGKTEVVEIRLRGFRDEDGDMKPEFDVDLEIFNHDIVPASKQRIELDPELVVKAIAGGSGGVGALFTAVASALQAGGIKLPF